MPTYPNRQIEKGETNKALVKAIQTQLNAIGCGPVDVDGDFGTQTVTAVKLFQSRHSDTHGNALVIDGKIGQITWSALFPDNPPVPTPDPTSPLVSKALEIAISQLGVTEKPLLSNRGPEVDQYLMRVGLNPVGQHYSWCAAFVYWCYDEAANALGRKNPLYKTAGCLEHWNNSTAKQILTADAVANPSLIKAGSIFIMSFGGGHGHTGIVESVSNGFLNTIEGNTNNDLSANGYGVFRLNRRKIGSIQKGFLDYSKK
jgi:hypothetical protein